MKNKWIIVCLILALSVSILACGTTQPTSTPYPIDTAVPKPPTPIIISAYVRGTSVTFLEILWIGSITTNDGKTIYPKAGYSFLDIKGLASGGDMGQWPKDLSANDVHIFNNQFTAWWIYRLYPLSGGTGPFRWTFEIQRNWLGNTLWIVLPDGVDIDLSPLIRNMPVGIDG